MSDLVSTNLPVTVPVLLLSKLTILSIDNRNKCVLLAVLIAAKNMIALRRKSNFPSVKC